MASTDKDTENNGRRRRRTEIGASSGWIFIIALLFMLQGVRYSGLMAWAAEWQFDIFGRYYPTFTFLLFVAIFGSPAFLFLWYRRHRSKANQEPDARYGGRAIAAATRLMRSLFVISGALAVAASSSLLLTFGLPSEGGAIQRVVVGSTSAISPVEGRTELVGDVIYDRISAFGENLLVAEKYTHFAPVAARANSQAPLRYFVELRQLPGKEFEFAPVGAGILKRNALPGEIAQLYRNVGYVVERPYYVLFASGGTMRWPFYVIAVELAAASLLFMLFGFIQRWRRDRLRSEVSETSTHA